MQRGGRSTWKRFGKPVAVFLMLGALAVLVHFWLSPFYPDSLDEGTTLGGAGRDYGRRDRRQRWRTHSRTSVASARTTAHWPTSVPTLPSMLHSRAGSPLLLELVRMTWTSRPQEMIRARPDSTTGSIINALYIVLHGHGGLASLAEVGGESGQSA